MGAGARTGEFVISLGTSGTAYAVSDHPTADPIGEVCGFADATGRFQTLEVETRLLKGPRTYDPSGAPLHPDNESVVTERIYLDKANANLLHDDITVLDHALTRPWAVMKTYRRNPDPRPTWIEYICADGQQLVRVGNEGYVLSADGLLMPTKKGQKPPDLRHFK